MPVTISSRLRSQPSLAPVSCLNFPLPEFDFAVLNRRFEEADPRDILAWSLENICSGLVQVSAFNVSGMVIMHLLNQELKPIPSIPVLFLDTLHHFPETLNLVEKAKQLYSLDLRVYKASEVDSQQAFAERYGEALWEKDPEQYAQLTKIEPLQRGLKELGTIAWLNGRRRDQSSTRAKIPIFEFDKQQRIKINPLATWTNEDVWAYVAKHQVIYNPLLDQGYTSIGDQHTTTPVKPGESVRAGRWRGSNRTECGIH